MQGYLLVYLIYVYVNVPLLVERRFVSQQKGELLSRAKIIRHHQQDQVTSLDSV
jgi:hypothetical protein